MKKLQQVLNTIINIKVLEYFDVWISNGVKIALTNPGLRNV